MTHPGGLRSLARRDQPLARGHLFVLGIPVKVKILGFPKSFFVVALACGRAVDGMLIGLAMGDGAAGSGDHVGSWSVGVCCGPCACRRPDLFRSTDTAVW